ncbi:outer membrane protein [Thalassobius sp. Cn5-15]|jgi:opacity protein-like surface antigen|uniref:outer membrane protein n=1 Tax=Thalassobius sp. Cn5-15 TaxID=2917763 RepID=UPI001EF39E48|nr:porin family protein [Thalassobius sp. Cn5-15]MCG7495114.1 porin family protein [Thalassobius sp. Cn5-15]
MTLNKLILTGVVATLTAAPAFAGSADPAPVDPTPEPVSLAPVAAPWTGGYVGLNLGYADIEAGALDADGGFYGLSAGYDYDLGDWVIGGGIDYDRLDIDLGGNDVESAARLKVRAGYDLGDGLLYGTAGAVRIDVDTLGDDTGYFIGAGYEHRVTDQVSVGGEILYHEVDDFNGSGVDVEATTIAAKVNFRF